jgi:hypothetical protein
LHGNLKIEHGSGAAISIMFPMQITNPGIVIPRAEGAEDAPKDSDR